MAGTVREGNFSGAGVEEVLLPEEQDTVAAQSVMANSMLKAEKVLFIVPKGREGENFPRLQKYIFWRNNGWPDPQIVLL